MHQQHQMLRPCGPDCITGVHESLTMAVARWPVLTDIICDIRCRKGKGGAGRQMAEKSSLLTCSIKGGGWHKALAQVIRALLLFQVIQLSDQDGKIHDGGFSPYSVVGQSGRWQRETLQPTKKAAHLPSTAAATVNPSIASGEHPARDTLDPSQSVAEGWGQKRGEIPVSGKQRC